MGNEKVYVKSKEEKIENYAKEGVRLVQITHECSISNEELLNLRFPPVRI